MTSDSGVYNQHRTSGQKPVSKVSSVGARRLRRNSETHHRSCVTSSFSVLSCRPKTGNTETSTSSLTMRGFLINCMRCFPPPASLTVWLSMKHDCCCSTDIITRSHEEETLFSSAWITFTLIPRFSRASTAQKYPPPPRVWSANSLIWVYLPHTHRLTSFLNLLE